mmetsp:Transcript_13539/g.41900  ORF Transcript_13539/g.41900 Transcript_13539/m.41900 type:complete len:249 (-) Transcript_13539:394-1140(-)
MWRCSASHVARASISVSASSAEASVSAASRRALAPPDARARAACARSSAVSRRSLRLCAPAAAARATNAAACDAEHPGIVFMHQRRRLRDRAGHIDSGPEIGIHGLRVGASGLRGRTRCVAAAAKTASTEARPRGARRCADRRTPPRGAAPASAYCPFACLRCCLETLFLHAPRAVCPRRSRASTRTAPKRSIAPSCTRCCKRRRTQPPAPCAHARWSAVKPSRSAAARSTPAAIAWARTSARPDWHA